MLHKESGQSGPEKPEDWKTRELENQNATAIEGKSYSISPVIFLYALLSLIKHVQLSKMLWYIDMA